MRFSRSKVAALALSLTAGLTAVAAPAVAAPRVTKTPATASADCGHACNVLFDDFDYRSSDDAKLKQQGWVVRTRKGGPGAEGASWSKKNISFPVVDGQRSLRLTSRTNGKTSGTSQSEFSRIKEESLAGTYAARIKLADKPASGRDGDFLVQSFFAISDHLPDCSRKYSETDFTEYLPNGGYGDTRTLNSQTTWARTGEKCSESTEAIQAKSFNGWHDIVSTVSKGHVKYYIDGHLLADHKGKYYPRHQMSIDFNQWFIDLTGHKGTATSTWHEDVDYVLYAKDRVLTPAQATKLVTAQRDCGVTYLNNLSTK